MRKLLSGAALLALAATAPLFAADLAVKAPPNIPPPLFSWTGCFVGGHVGGAVREDRLTSTLGRSGSFDAGGFVGGGQIGCDYQFAGGWVVGAEGRAAWTSLKSTNAGTVVFPAIGVTVPSQRTTSSDYLASATVRLGYSVADRWLVFARGGAAWTNEKIDSAFIRPDGLAVDPRVTDTRTGWTVGTGVDWAFAPHWSATLEYNYYNFGNNSPVMTDNFGTRVTIFSLKDNIHAVTTGVNYHF
jgi:outer membrane immunogenic protein